MLLQGWNMEEALKMRFFEGYEAGLKTHNVYLSDLTPEEIAEDTGLSIEQVKFYQQHKVRDVPTIPKSAIAIDTKGKEAAHD
jgi:hypothetical protein